MDEDINFISKMIKPVEIDPYTSNLGNDNFGFILPKQSIWIIVPVTQFAHVDIVFTAFHHMVLITDDRPDTDKNQSLS